MLLNQFPDLKWIQEQSRTNFENQNGAENVKLKKKGWPNVVLNTLSSKTERNNIKAPFSLFTNHKGKSHVKADGKEVSVSSDTYCLVNHGDTYDLNISEDETLTFNIHFSDQLYHQTLYSAISSHESLLDQPNNNIQNHHVTCSHWKDSELKLHIQKIQDFYTLNDKVNEDAENKLLSDMLIHLLIKNGESAKGLQKINAQKLSTRKELIVRVSRARDYIHEKFNNPITIDELAQIATLSKYHFLRIFKEVYACTPHQYLAKIRLQKAEQLLKTNLEIYEIAHRIGFEETNSFYQFFKRSRGITPLGFRFRN
ncbi:helix-turn-helix domain-containing protein [Ekhidna sp.]|uniref:helix-turn-helix domain-containing protein n=1 Tax=Ekhidna sp. TaxID=2608089 RepID=UPI003B5C1433